MKLFAAIDNIIDWGLKIICLLSLIVLFLLLALNVFFRFVPVYSMGWFDEIIELTFAYLSFFGAAFLWKRREHSRIDFLVEKYANTKKAYTIELVINIISFVLMIFLVVYSIDLIGRATAWSPIFKISRKVFYACLPISAGIMGIYAFKDMIVYVSMLLGKDLKILKTYDDY